LRRPLPTLTVITPSLNQGAFIERAIRSVLDQGREDLEYLVVDGGSTDETVDVIRRYEDAIDWWVSEPDEGQTDALAKGLARATGDVVAYINSDDYYLPGAFDKALAALEGSSAGWVAGAAINVDEQDRPTEELGGVWVPTLPTEGERWPRGRHWFMLNHWSVPQPATFWRRELFEKYGGFRRDMHFAFDVEFMERLAIAGEMPLLLRDEKLAARVMHSDAKSSDIRRWTPEYRLMRRVLRRELTARERACLRAGLILRGLSRLYTVPRDAYRSFRLKGGVRNVILHPALSRLGDLLDHLPERVRPKVRTRDRR
jgi:glycosyltransferase involved in cell wall biosynthesis